MNEALAHDDALPAPSALPRRVLVVRPDRIGDVVLITPLLRALRRHFPNGSIAALVRPYAAGVLEHNPHIDDLLLDDLDGADAGRPGFWRKVSEVRQHRFDTALMPLPTSRHAWMCFLAGIRRRYATSRKLYNRLTLTRVISRNRYVPLRHEAEYCLKLAHAIGAPTDGLHTEMFLQPSEVDQARQALGLDADDHDTSVPLVGIHPGSGGSAPNWPVALYVQLAERLLRDTNARFVLTGGPADRHLRAAFAHLPADRCIDVMDSPSLRHTAALLAQLRVFVSASTGPMHMAAALRVPTVSLFCPLSACSPKLWGPLGNTGSVVLPRDSYCQGDCPGTPHICTFEGGIELQAVATRVLQVLDERPHTPATT